MRSVLVTTALLCAALAAAACSSQQFYGVGQAWQRNECYKINDAQERGRCLASSSRSFDAYQREAEAARQGQ
jgi:hypothetical protein